MNSNRSLNELTNIGKTVALRLNEIGVHGEADLRAMGSVQAYNLIAARTPGKTFSVCYYLYSLEGALLDLPWDDLPRELKHQLEGQVRPAKQRSKRK